MMSGIKTRKWLNKKPFDGLPKREDFEIAEEELPPLKDGGIIIIVTRVLMIIDHNRISC